MAALPRPGPGGGGVPAAPPPVPPGRSRSAALRVWCLDEVATGAARLRAPGPEA